MSKNRLLCLNLSFIFLSIVFMLSCSKDPVTTEKKSDALETGAVTDIDGNVYQTVKIGGQWWMAENLKTTRYRNGDALLKVTHSSEWAGLESGAFCSYNNDDSNVSTVGLLYNWYAVDDNRNIAPVGWHVPTDAELKELEIYLGMEQSDVNRTGFWRGADQGLKLKQTGATHWNSPNNGTNESGFSALSSGSRSYAGTFADMGATAFYWSSTPSGSDRAWYRLLNNSLPGVFRYQREIRNGYSVRCIKN